VAFRGLVGRRPRRKLRPQLPQTLPRAKSRTAATPFTGRIREREFWLRPRGHLLGPYSLAPHFHGFLISTGNSTRVVGRFQLHPLVFAVLLSTFVFAVVVAAAVAEQAIYVQSESGMRLLRGLAILFLMLSALFMIVRLSSRQADRCWSFLQSTLGPERPNSALHATPAASLARRDRRG
jgi:hypothetical protein